MCTVLSHGGLVGAEITDAEWDFWRARVRAQAVIETRDGETTEQSCERLARRAAAAHGREWRAAHAAGLCEDPRFEVIMAGQAAFNAERRRLAAAGGIIYGPLQFNRHMYYDYRHSRMLLALKTHFQQTRFRASDEQLAAYYHERLASSAEDAPAFSDVLPQLRRHYTDHQFHLWRKGNNE